MIHHLKYFGMGLLMWLGGPALLVAAIFYVLALLGEFGTWVQYACAAPLAAMILVWIYHTGKSEIEGT